METKSFPPELPPSFIESGLASSFESEYGSDAAKAANEYCKERSNLVLRELTHELRTTLTSLNGAASRLSSHLDCSKQIGDSSDLQHRVRALNRFTKQLNDLTFSGREATCSKVSMQQLLTEAYETASSLLANEGTSNISLKLHGDDFFTTVSPQTFLKALVGVIRSISSSRSRGKAKRLLNIRFQRTKLSATIEIYKRCDEVLDFHDSQVYINKHINRQKAELAGLSIAANCVAALSGSLLLASKGGELRQAIIKLPLAG